MPRWYIRYIQTVMPDIVLFVLLYKEDDNEVFSLNGINEIAEGIHMLTKSNPKFDLKDFQEISEKAGMSILAEFLDRLANKVEKINMISETCQKHI